MYDDIRIQDLSAAEIKAVFENLGEEDLCAVAEFVRQIGGLENARLAIDMLSQLEDAA